MEKTKKITLIAAFLLVCFGLIWIFAIFTDTPPILSEYLTEENITFTSDSGDTEKVEPNSDSQIRFDGTYTSTYIYIPNGDGYLSLTLNYGVGESILRVNDKEIYSGKTDSYENMIDCPEIKIGVIPQDENIYISLDVRYTDDVTYIFPPLVKMQDIGATERYTASVINSSALLAGISGFCFLLIIALFFLSLFFSAPDPSLPFLALGTLIFCVSRLFETGAIICPDALYDIVYGVLPYTVAPLMLIFIILNRKKKTLKYFLIISTVMAIIITLAYILRYTFDHVPEIVLQMQMLAEFVSDSLFDKAVMLASGYLIMLCVVAALTYHAINIIRTESEKTALEAQNRTVVSGYKNLVNNVKRTAEVRHEWKHDLLTLSLLYKQGKIDEIGQYLNEKNEFIDESERVHFTENFVFDVILGSAAARAADEGVELKTYLNIRSQLNIKEEELCQLLMNMFDNSFNACAKVDGDKFISFTAEMKNSFLAIKCSNSMPVKQEEHDDISHGWGLKNMRAICRKYGSELITQSSDGVFTAKTALQVSEK